MYNLYHQYHPEVDVRVHSAQATYYCWIWGEKMTVFLAHYWYYRPLPANITFLLCYRLSCVPTFQFIRRSPNHQCDSVWRQGLQRVRVTWDRKVTPHPTGPVSLQEGDRTPDALWASRGEVGRGYTEMWPSASREGRPREKPTCWHLGLGLQLLGLWRITVWCLSHLRCHFLLWQPELTNITSFCRIRINC